MLNLCDFSALLAYKKIMQKMGLEPTRYCYHRHLKPARLPIPPLLHFLFINRSLATAHL